MDVTKAESEVEEALVKGAPLLSCVAASVVTSWIGGYDCRWSIARMHHITDDQGRDSLHSIRPL